MNRDLFAAAGGVVDAITDPYFNSTTLLLSGDGTNGAQNNTFVDSSVNNATITRAGSPTQGSFSPFSQTGWSTYFNGSSSNLQIASNAALALGTGDFTIEMWVYNTSSTNRLLSYGTVNSPILYINGSNFVQYDNYGSASLQTSSIAVPLNAWSHIAVVRLASNTKIYINGAQASTGADATNWLQAGFYIGVDISTTFMTGYLSNLRVVKGVAVYTGAFTPPTAPLSRTQSAGTNIVALSGTETNLLTLQDNRFKDNSTNNFAITAVGTPSVQAFSPFAPTAAYSLPVAAAGSAYFNGSTDRLTTPSNSSFAFGTGDFTIEGWFNTAVGTNNGFLQISDTAGGFKTTYVNTIGITLLAGKLNLYGVAGTGYTSTGSSYATSTWNHFALVRSSSVTKLYINGVLDTTIGTSGSITDSTNYSMSYIAIGGYYSTAYLLTGYLSNIRIVKGVAVYTGNFTPSGTPLSKIQSAGTNIAALSGTETSILTLQDSTFKDNSTNVVTITASSPAPVIQSFTPFTQVWGGYFPGTINDYLSLAYNPSITLSKFYTNNFTVECWAYLTTSSGDHTILSAVSGWGNAANYNIEVRAGGLMHVQLGNNITMTVGTVSFPINQWNHVALVRTGLTTTKLYLNGTAVVTNNDNWTADEDCPLTIGVFNINGGSLGNSWLGYISNLRIVSGTAVYTGAFTPPTKTLSATQAAGTNISAITGTATSLLTLQDPTFKDNAILPNTITVAGTPKAQLVSAPFTSAATVDPVSGSGYFNGTSDYLTVPNSALLQVGAVNFTIECWTYLTTRLTTGTGQKCLIAKWNDGQLEYLIDYYSGNLRVLDSDQSIMQFACTLNAGTWYHIALAKSGSSTTLYINGISAVSYGMSFRAATSSLFIGYKGGASAAEWWPGYISNLRIVKGTAVYTGNFTPPAAPPQPTQPSGLLGSNVNAIDGTNTSLLLLGSNAGIYDATAKNDIITVGDARISTSVTKYGSGAMYFDGTGDYLNIPNNQIVNFASGNYTVEAWVYPTVITGDQYVFSFGVPGGHWSINIYQSNWRVGYNLSIAGGSASAALNTWTHVAVTRSSGTQRFYLNGALISSVADTNVITANGTVYVGAYFGSGNYWNGYIDDLRVTKYARYTANFTPPTKAMIGQ